MRRFLRTESAGGALLLASALVALAWANLASASYDSLWHDAAVHRAVNDGLMSLFFLVVGIEIKRELVDGELRDPRTAALPVFAAVGGMVVPAVLYLAIAGGRGWGVPMATDIAFAVGLLTLVGDRVPPALKLFLLSLAIVDDIGAVLVIALVYGGGIHPTIVAVVLGLAAPVRWGARVEEPLHLVSSFLVVPLFALANAGVELTWSGLDGSVTIAVIAGLVTGKLVGVTGAAWLAVRSGAARLPSDTTWPMVAAVGLVAGMGFTVSLFISDLAFTDATSAKLGVLVATATAGVAGNVAVRRAIRA